MTSRLLLTLVILACTCSYLSLCNGDQVEFDVSSTGKAQEYCLAAEPFQAKCLRNEVIVMTSALYGRMKVGRCLQDVSDEMLAKMGNDPRFLGCSVDALQIFDRRCSGKNQCEVLTFDPDLQREKPCHAGLTNYLEGSYECVTVIEADRSCHVTVSSNPLHIMRSSSSTSALLNCGTKTQPWVLEAPAGQQINVSLLHFGLQQRERVGTNQQHCIQQYGYIVDKAAANKNISICGMAKERSSNIYQSSMNAIELIFKESAIQDSENHDENLPILLGFKAIGCSNVVPPEDAWLKRSNNEAVVGCYTSRQSWHLRCVDNVWVGVIGNCSTGEKDFIQKIESTVVPYFDNQVLVTVAIAAAGLIVCVVIIICGAVCIRRYSAMIKGSGYVHQQDYKMGAAGKYGHAAPITQQVLLNGTMEGTEQQA